MKIELYDIGEILYAVGLKREINHKDNENHDWFDIIYKGKLAEVKINSDGIFYGIDNYNTRYFIDYYVYNDKQKAFDACKYYDTHYKLREISVNEQGEKVERVY